MIGEKVLMPDTPHVLPSKGDDQAVPQLCYSKGTAQLPLQRGEGGCSRYDR